MDLDFNVNDYEALEGFELLPIGWYPVVARTTEAKHSKAGNRYMSIENEVIDGACKGRKAWDNLNLWHPDKTTQDIARRKLKAINDAVGKPPVRNSQELCNTVYGIHIKHRKDSNTGEMREQIAGYCTEKELASKMASNPSVIQTATTTTSTGIGAPANEPWA